MEFIGYESGENASTIKITNEELGDILSIVTGLRSTFPSQDKTIFLGIDEARLEELSSLLLAMLQKRGVVKR